MDPAAPQPFGEGFLKAIGWALRQRGIRTALVVGGMWLLLRNLSVVVRILRLVGRPETAERLERELGDREMVFQELIADPASAAPSAGDVGRQVIDQLGMPEATDGSVAKDVEGERPVAEPEGTKPEPGPAKPPPVSATAWLTSLKEKESREHDRTEERRRRHVEREGLLFRVLLLVAIVTAAFATLGAALVLAGFVPVGVVSAALALLPGAGTVLIRDMWKHERERRDAAEVAQTGYAAVLEATEFALALEDGAERSNQAKAIAERLQERAFAG
jgi:hypothetical protein